MSTAAEETSLRLQEIRERKRALHEEVMRQMSVRFAAAYDSEEYLAAVGRIDEIDIERKALDDEQTELFAERERLWDEQQRELEYKLAGFTRPTGLIVGIINRGLGALPNQALVIQPTKDALQGVRSYRLLALVSLIAAAALLIGLVTYVPFMGVSPYTLTYYGMFALTDSHVVSSLVSVAMFLLFIYRLGFQVQRCPHEGKFLDNYAMLEEQWFRMGAENWSLKQRVYSCGAFGIVHITNFIYPIASLLVVGFVVGGIAMLVYLHEYRASNDTVRATIAATKFHAAYNRLAVVYMVIALSLVLGFNLLP